MREDTSPTGRYVVLCTAPGEVAEGLARDLVEERVAACVNVVPGLVSVYRWRGRIERDAEVLLVIKTDAERLPALVEAVQARHPYECPEVVALPIAAGAVPYLEWIGRALDEEST